MSYIARYFYTTGETLMVLGAALIVIDQWNGRPLAWLMVGISMLIGLSSSIALWINKKEKYV